VCQICATNPANAAKIDFVDSAVLLIPCNLVKGQNRPENPAYRLARHFFNVFDGF
jgi:hypothetical protein